MSEQLVECNRPAQLQAGILELHVSHIAMEAKGDAGDWKR
jgi:hypothetical protein